MVYSLTCKCELTERVGSWRFKRLFGLVPRWRQGSRSVTAFLTGARSNSRRRLMLPRFATLTSSTSTLPMRLLLSMIEVNIQEVNIQAHRDLRENYLSCHAEPKVKHLGIEFSYFSSRFQNSILLSATRSTLNATIIIRPSRHFAGENS